MITCPDIVDWSEWHSGPGRLTRSHIYERVDKDAVIIEYRVGYDARDFAELTFYQAKYRLPGGEIMIAPADGPQPLVSIDEQSAMTYSIILALLTVPCFWLASRFPISRPNSVHEIS